MFQTHSINIILKNYWQWSLFSLRRTTNGNLIFHSFFSRRKRRQLLRVSNIHSSFALHFTSAVRSTFAWCVSRLVSAWVLCTFKFVLLDEVSLWQGKWYRPKKDSSSVQVVVCASTSAFEEWRCVYKPIANIPAIQYGSCHAIILATRLFRRFLLLPCPRKASFYLLQYLFGCVQHSSQ